MITIPQALDLTEKQRAYFSVLLSHYKNRNTLSAQLLFVKNSNYVPHTLKHGEIYENLGSSEFLSVISKYSSSLIEHDGAVFVYPNGRVIFGAIIDPLMFIKTLPKTIREFGAARALLRLVTLDSENDICCGLKCGKNLSLFYKGEKHLLHKAKVNKTNHVHNYGIGLIIADKLPDNESIKIIKMGGYKKIPVHDITELANCIASICHAPKHHDGFWVYSLSYKIVSGPYLILANVSNEHAQSNEGLKRLTATLISHNLNLPVLLLRENSTKFIIYGLDIFDLTSNLQKQFDVFAGYIAAEAIVA